MHFLLDKLSESVYNSSMKSDSVLIKSHLPCPDCGSSDALATYSDHTYCFSCGTSRSQPDNKETEWGAETSDDAPNNNPLAYLINKTKGLYISSKNTAPSMGHVEKSTGEGGYEKINKGNALTNYSIQYLSWRGVTADTFKAYGCSFKVTEAGVPHSVSYPYLSSTGEAATKERLIDTKQFFSTGAMNDSSLFGMDRFSAGSARAITITEGELDALSVYQMLGSRYPAVSVRGSSSARRDCERARDYLNSFERIYLCFDTDEPGQKALKEVAALFDVNKVVHVKLDKYKDANEYLIAGEAEEFKRIWWNSKPFIPKGIVNDYDSIKDLLSAEGGQAIATYPFQTLNSMTYGIRQGEVLLFLAQEKVGKTEVMRAIEYHLLKSTDENIGIIHLEEEEKRSVQGLVGYELGVPAHLPDSGLSIEDMLKAYQTLTKRDGRVHYYSHFGSDDPNIILDIIRYLVAVCKCKFIFLDHITMLVTGFEDDDERKKLDFISTRLAMMTRELDFTLFLVSHVNDDGKTRGSRNISKVADLIVSLERDIEAASFDERNKTYITVRGNRYAGLSGPAGTLMFDPGSFTLNELTVEGDEAKYDPGF